jgi:hypothetical protein
MMVMDDPILVVSSTALTETNDRDVNVTSAALTIIVCCFTSRLSVPAALTMSPVLIQLLVRLGLELVSASRLDDKSILFRVFVVFAF